MRVDVPEHHISTRHISRLGLCEEQATEQTKEEGAQQWLAWSRDDLPMQEAFIAGRAAGMSCKGGCIARCLCAAGLLVMVRHLPLAIMGRCLAMELAWSTHDDKQGRGVSPGGGRIPPPPPPIITLTGKSIGRAAEMSCKGGCIARRHSMIFHSLFLSGRPARYLYWLPHDGKWGEEGERDGHTAAHKLADLADSLRGGEVAQARTNSAVAEKKNLMGRGFLPPWFPQSPLSCQRGGQFY